MQHELNGEEENHIGEKKFLMKKTFFIFFVRSVLLSC